jgi:hypothetical protein
MKMTLTIDMGNVDQEALLDDVRISYDAETKVLAVETLPELEARLLSLFVLDNQNPPEWMVNAFRIYMRSDLVAKCCAFMLEIAKATSLLDGRETVRDVSYEEMQRTFSELLSRAPS